MSKYTLISVKGTRTVSGDVFAAVRAAVAMEDELQPAYGVSVEAEDGSTVAEVRDGAILGLEVEGGEGEDHDTGHVERIDGDSAFVAWDSGVKTPMDIAALTVIE